MKTKLFTLCIAALLLSVGSYALFFHGGSHAYEFRFDKVSQGDVTVYVTATGTINPVTSIDVGTQVSGIILKLYADFNSVVKRGQVIAQIDSTFLVQAVKDAEASLYKANAQLSDSKRNLDREKDLVDRKLDAQINYDAALTTHESNLANLKSAESALDRAKINLAYATIYAPVDGVVINRQVNVGQTVAASLSSPTLYTIADDLSKMQVLSTVDESDIGRISIGQEATFTVDAYPDETFRGVISQIRLAPVSIQNVVNYTVVIEVNNDQLKLMPGMTANVKILVAKMQNVLRIPNMALRFQPPPDAIDSASVNASRQNANPNETGSTVHEAGRLNKGTDPIAHPGNLLVRQTTDTSQPVMKGRIKTSEKTPFGIDNRFPEYQKSAYVPDSQTGRGRIWIMGPTGMLTSVFVRTGVSDGKFTELLGSKLKADEQIVMGVISGQSASTGQVQSPLTSATGPQRPGGGAVR